MDPQILAAVIGPMLTALLAALAVGFKEWRNRRDWEDRRDRSLRQATQEVAYIDAWLTAHAKVADEASHREKAARALDDLERSYATVAAAVIEDQSMPRVKTLRDRAGALLLIPLNRTRAKVVRVFYWVALAVGLLLSMASIAVAQKGDQSVAFNLLVAMTVTLLCFLPAILLAVVAKLLDRPLRRGSDATVEAGPWTPSYTEAYPGYPESARFPQPGLPPQGVPQAAGQQPQHHSR
ncbi:hypothetical protein GCM10009841_07490 [Microlunatus panaciterrae]|uniref:Uncharacterized protein n=1 Tax=Microlunatus panaciterrae TaxID=400768 RepID=A0ABS2RJ59_9ACTN|nr:hypothetical protein [Microlunatus panaciterrae]MBM7798597.1 hypothetical protein [Microlunatus panaciterrae]